MSNKKTTINKDMSLACELKLITKNEYTSVLRQYLPASCFEPDVKHVFHYLFFMFIFLLGMFSLINIELVPLRFVVSIFMGISLAALTFFLHDLCHGSIIKSKPVSYLVGLSIGIFNFFAPTFWQRVHNLHHARTGNTDDPDRSYILSEKPKNLFEKLIYKTRISNETYHPFLGLVFISTGFIWYFLNTMFYGFVGKKTSVEEDKKYRKIQELFKKDKGKFLVLLELFLIITFQVFLFSFIASGSFLNYFLISLLPVGICHFVAMSYIHTNHFLSPLTGEVDDPLINSLSLKNSWIVDKLYSNFSHHVEHHLFPSMGSVHYPKVRKLLQKLYPDRFQLIPMIDTMKLLLKTPRIYGDCTHLISSDGTKKVNCLLPKA